MLRQLATVEVKILIIDKIQTRAREAVAQQRQFLNAIKHLGNELQIPIVTAGTQDAFKAIQTDPQLANRFEPVLLRRWTMGEDYLRLLASFAVALPLEQRSGLVEPALAHKILSLCRHWGILTRRLFLDARDRRAVDKRNGVSGCER